MLLKHQVLTNIRKTLIQPSHIQTIIIVYKLKSKGICVLYNDEEKRESKEEKKETANAAELLNGYLFAEPELSPESLSNEGKNKKASFSVLKTATLLILVLAVAFSGAFSGMYWICRTALTADSDFLSTLILKMSGVTINRVDVDYVSGEYVGDSVELADKIMKPSLALTGYIWDEALEKHILATNGSGVIISSKGIAVTNRHVAFGLDRLDATDYNGKTYKCEIIAVDEKTDLAVIKLLLEDGDVITPVTAVADSSKAVMGQSIAVVGNPLGMGLSYSCGYVSHPDRDIGERGGNFIQIDATVNPGNSGGGLFDADGNLLGIITLKAKGDNVDGIGYAIPSNRMLDVLNDLLEFGYVTGRPALGVSIATVNSSNWQYWSENDLRGVLGDRKYGVFIITSKYTDEMKLGDRIVSINGRVITENADISAIIDECNIGDVLGIELERPIKGNDGLITYEKVSITFTLRERDWADALK